jgi:hypothetical protein
MTIRMTVRVTLMCALAALIALSGCKAPEFLTGKGQEPVEFGMSPDSIEAGCRIDARQKVKAAGPVDTGYASGAMPDNRSDWEMEKDEYDNCLTRHGVTPTE